MHSSYITAMTHITFPVSETATAEMVLCQCVHFLTRSKFVFVGAMIWLKVPATLCLNFLGRYLMYCVTFECVCVMSVVVDTPQCL